jgi:hypothetical protein
VRLQAAGREERQQNRQKACDGDSREPQISASMRTS